MEKVYVKIPGVDMPYGIIGNYSYDNEKFYVLDDAGIKKRILWSNILYIEDLRNALVVPSEQTSDVVEAPSINLPKVSDDKLELSVIFSGHKNQVFKIPDVPSKILGSEWTPDLAKVIFSNSQIKAFMGDFVVSEVKVSGENVNIKTEPLGQKKQEVVLPNKSKLTSDPALAAEKLQKGAEMVSKIFQANDGAVFKKPTGPFVNNFNMTTSPFDSPVSFKDNSEGE